MNAGEQKAYQDMWWSDPENQKLITDYRFEEGDVVVDVGGYLGDWTLAVSTAWQFRLTRAFVFEPIMHFHRRCAQNLAAWPNVKVLNIALGDRWRTIQFGIDMESSGQYCESAAKETVNIKPVEEVFRDLGITKVKLLSLNCEGAEYAILRNLIESQMIGSIENLQVQFHAAFPAAEQLREHLREEIALTHDERFRFDWVWEGWKLK